MFPFDSEIALNKVHGPCSEMLANIHAQHTTPHARYAATRDNYSALWAQAQAKDAAAASRGMPVGANTYSGTLVTNFLMDGSITDLQNVWAFLNAYSIASECDPFKPLATGILKHVTGGEATQVGTTAPASFEPSGGSTVDPFTLTAKWYNQPLRVGANDLNSGLRIEELRTKALATFADSLTQAATAPITAAAFTATPIISSAAAFNLSDTATLQGALQKSTTKNLILDGTFKARIANTPGYFQPAGTVGGGPDGWKPFGWDGIYLASNWSGAGANIKGLACNPQAMIRATGLPINSPGASPALNTVTFALPGCNVAVAMSSWFSLATRTQFVSWDLIAAFAVGDTSAGVIVASGTPG